MAENVLADPQFSLAVVLKPFDGFESVYQGKAGDQPIAFFAPDENGQRPALDPDAGKPGFDPHLLRYMSVPLGARLVVWIPVCVSSQPGGPSITIITRPYQYAFHWRLRTVTDFRNRRVPFHISRQFPGQTDTSAVPPDSGQRLILPGATRTIVVHQPEAVANLTQVSNLRREKLNFRADPISTAIPPLLPDGSSGVHMQGVLDPGLFPPGGLSTQSLFLPFWCDVEGDELLITAQHVTPTPLDELFWDFTAYDMGFSNIYGTNFVPPTHPPFDGAGIYLMMGVNP